MICKVWGKAGQDNLNLGGAATAAVTWISIPMNFETSYFRLLLILNQIGVTCPIQNLSILDLVVKGNLKDAYFETGMELNIIFRYWPSLTGVI